jgi:hypothetical protein
MRRMYKVGLCVRPARPDIVLVRETCADWEEGTWYF